MKDWTLSGAGSVRFWNSWPSAASPSGMRHISSEAERDERVVVCLDGRPLLHTSAHYSPVIMAAWFDFFPLFVMTASFWFFISREELLGFLVSLASLSSFSWAVTAAGTSLARVTAQKWTEITSHFMRLPLPFFLLTSVTVSLCSVAHIDTCIFCCHHPPSSFAL